MPEKKKIGFIGIGMMGFPMAHGLSSYDWTGIAAEVEAEAGL